MPHASYWAIFPCGHQVRAELRGTFLLPRAGLGLDGTCPLHGKACRPTMPGDILASLQAAAAPTLIKPGP